MAHTRVLLFKPFEVLRDERGQSWQNIVFFQINLSDMQREEFVHDHFTEGPHQVVVLVHQWVLRLDFLKVREPFVEFEREKQLAHDHHVIFNGVLSNNKL